MQQPFNRQNLDPKVWGPVAWRFIDYIVMGYPVNAPMEEQMAMERFISALGNALPCEKCRVNFTRYTGMYPPVLYLSGRERLAYWFNSYKRWSKTNG